MATKWISEEWTSLRDKWPFQRGSYKIYDCKTDSEGTADYDGIEFFNENWNVSLKGSLLLQTYRISHWKKHIETSRK